MSTHATSQSLGSPTPGPKSSGSYVEDVLRTMLNDQSDHVYCKFTDSYLKYRRVVVEWMVDVAEYFNLHLTTTHAAIAYLDRLQPNEKYSRFEWQMMAICCLIISSKYNECEEHVPPLHKLEEITQQAMSNECVLNYELWALKRMGWKLNASTPMAFLDSYLYLARRMPDARALHMSCFSDPDFESAVARLATKCMVDEGFKHLPASAIAAGIIYFVRESIFCEPVWTSALSRLTGHDAPTSKSVQRVLEQLDALARREAADMQRQLAAQQQAAHAAAQAVLSDSEADAEASQLDDSSFEASREETGAGLSAALESLRLAAHRDGEVDLRVGSCDSQDSQLERTASAAAVVGSRSALSAAATRVFDFFASTATAKQPLQPQAQTGSKVTPAPTVKTIGGEDAPEKTKFSPVSIADFEA